MLDTTSCSNGSLVFSGLPPREIAATRNDHSGFADRMGAEHPPAKSRPPGDCVAPQTGGLRAEKTRVQLPRRLLVSFEHMQHRESFGVTTAKWPPCPSRCRRARRVRALCQSGFRLSRRSRRLPGSFETIDPITALPMASTPYRLRAEPPQPRRTRAPRDGQNNGQVSSKVYSSSFHSDCPRCQGCSAPAAGRTSYIMSQEPRTGGPRETTP